MNLATDSESYKISGSSVLTKTGTALEVGAGVSSVAVNQPLSVVTLENAAANSLSISTASTGAIATFAIADYEGAKLVIKAKEQGGSGYTHIIELLLTTDGTNIVGTPYASTYTGTGPLMSLSAAIVNAGADVEVRVVNLSAQTILAKHVMTLLTA